MSSLKNQMTRAQNGVKNGEYPELKPVSSNLLLCEQNWGFLFIDKEVKH